LLWRQANRKKGLHIAKQMLEKPTSILHQINNNRSNFVAACRFFKNPKVDNIKLIQPLLNSTAESSVGKDVLVIQDTTELNYEHHSGYLSRKDKDLGPTGNDIDMGFFMHPSIVIDLKNEILLGASDLHIWNRRYDKKKKNERDYKKEPIEIKESYRWIASALRSKEVLKEASSILFVSDRESDIFDEFVEVPDSQTDVLIRSKENRRLHESDFKLYEYLDTIPMAGSISLNIRNAKHRTARQATLNIKFTKVSIVRPKRVPKQKNLPAYFELNAIEVRENASSVPDGEKPICWVLLTTRPVDSLLQALYLIKCYALRWQIELIFSTLKSKGLNIEESQLETGKALKSLSAMSFITSIRINQLRLAHDKNNEAEATIVFTPEQIILLKALVGELEGKTEKQKNPHAIESLAWAVWVIARLGGWKGYSSESPPGNKTMFIGWNDFNRMYSGWKIARNLN
jgi:hypothetical protein